MSESDRLALVAVAVGAGADIEAAWQMVGDVPDAADLGAASREIYAHATRAAHNV